MKDIDTSHLNPLIQASSLDSFAHRYNSLDASGLQDE